MGQMIETGHAPDPTKVWAARSWRAFRSPPDELFREARIPWLVTAFGIISCATGTLFSAAMIVNPGLAAGTISEPAMLSLAGRTFALAVGLAVALLWRRPVVLALMFGLGVIREVADGASAFVAAGSPGLLPLVVVFIVAEVLSIWALLRHKAAL